MRSVNLEQLNQSGALASFAHAPSQQHSAVSNCTGLQRSSLISRLWHLPGCRATSWYFHQRCSLIYHPQPQGQTACGISKCCNGCVTGLLLGKWVWVKKGHRYRHRISASPPIPRPKSCNPFERSPSWKKHKVGWLRSPPHPPKNCCCLLCWVALMVSFSHASPQKDKVHFPHPLLSNDKSSQTLRITPLPISPASLLN